MLNNETLNSTEINKSDNESEINSKIDELILVGEDALKRIRYMLEEIRLFLEYKK